MNEAVREQLSYQIDGIADLVEQMLKTLKDISIKLWYGESEWAEEADIILQDMSNKVGDALDEWDVLVDSLIH